MKSFDASLFETLCGMMCTQTEIANVLRLDPQTLSKYVQNHYGKDYKTAYAQFSDDGRVSLRRLQLRLAAKSAAMAIFLGKNWLGQRDTPLTDMHPEELTQNFEAMMRQIQAYQAKKATSPQSEESQSEAPKSE